MPRSYVQVRDEGFVCRGMWLLRAAGVDPGCYLLDLLIREDSDGSSTVPDDRVRAPKTRSTPASFEKIPPEIPGLPRFELFF
jgi:hypothetical protein